MRTTSNRIYKFFANAGIIKSTWLIAFATAIFTSGCCSIVSSKSVGVPISVTPSYANILVIDTNKGIILQRIKGTGIVTLNGMTENHQCARYQVYAFAKNYLPSTAILTAKHNPWMAGNLIFIVFGGFGGMIACKVDELNGTAYVMPTKPLCLDLRLLTEDADEMKIPQEKDFYKKTRKLSSEDFEKAFMQRIEMQLEVIRRAQIQKSQTNNYR